MKYVLEMNLAHDLFLGLMPSILLCLFFPSKRIFRTRKTIHVLIALIFGALAGAAPYYYLSLTRKGLIFPPGFLIALVLLGINVCLMILFRERENAFLQKAGVLGKKAVLLSDILFPFAVWAIYKRDRGARFNLARVLPAFYFFLPIMVLGLTLTSERQFYPADQRFFQPIRTAKGYFNLISDDESQRVWASRGEDILLYHWGDPGSEMRTSEGPFLGDGVNTFALDLGRNTCLAAHAYEDRLRLKEMEALTLKTRGEWEFTLDLPRPAGSSITLWDPDRKILASVFESFMVRFSKDGRSIHKRFYGVVDANSARLDPKRRRIYVCQTSPGLLLSLDADTLEVKDSLAVPKMAKRLAIDEKRDRLFVSFPRIGSIWVLDLNTFKRVGFIPSILGVRSLFVDQGRGILMAGGFSPYMEIYNLEDYSFMGRLAAPAWLRSIALNRNDSRAFFTSRYGLWQWDESNLSISPFARWSDRLDPFFLFQRWAFYLYDRIHKPPPTDLSKFYPKDLLVEGVEYPPAPSAAIGTFGGSMEK